MKNKLIQLSLAAISLVFSVYILSGILGSYSWKTVTNPAALFELKNWELCFGIDAQTCQKITLPQTSHPDPKNFHWMNLSTSFPQIDACKKSSCSILFSEIGEAAEIYLNGVLIKKSGDFPPNFQNAKNFPVVATLPPEILKAENNLKVVVYTSQIPQSGIRGKFNGVYLSSDARQFERFTNFYNIDLPLLQALIFLIFAIYAWRTESKIVSIRPYFVAFKWSSVFGALFMLSYTGLQKEHATPWISNTTHHMLRHLMDWGLIWFLLSFYAAEPATWKQKHYKFYKVIQHVWRISKFYAHGILAVGMASFILSLAIFSIADSATQGTFASLLPYKITTALGWVKCLLLPVLLLGAAVDTREAPLGRAGTTAILLLFVYFQLDDMFAFTHDLVGISWAKLYPALIQFFYFTKIDEEKDFEILARARKSKIDAEKAKINSRVAHNIRHPLVALNQLIRRVGAELSPTDLRDFKSCATTLSQTIIELEGTQPLQMEAQSTLVAAVCERAFEFKRVEYQKLPVELSINIQDSALGVFCKVIPSEIFATLSNLIKNSVEACEGISDARVDLTLRRHPSSGRLEIIVSDNGKGIPSDMLSLLGQKQITNKTGGHGIGVFEAKKYMEHLGGAFNIYSKENERTVVTLSIPPCQKPPIITESLDLRSKAEVIIVDAEHSFASFMRERFHAHAPKLKVTHFETLEQFENFLEKEPKLEETIILIDNFFPKSETTGLDIIEKYEIQRSAYLSTHQIEDQELLRDTKLIDARIIPKIMAPVIQLVADKQRQPTFVLIDNDRMIRSAWGESAQKKKVKLKIFSSVRDFYKELPLIPYDSQLFIDASIHGTNDGLSVARDVQFLGFNFVKIASGTSKHNAPADAQDLDFVGKEPPWLRRKVSS
ncbi:MAG: HAMP domain-containing sensor histidine kinase [Bdellovibrionota bacterium]